MESGNNISINFDMDTIDNKSSDEKLNLLLRIAFDNHKRLTEHGKILFGENGEEGLVESVRSLCKGIKWFWVISSGTVAFLSTVLAQHLLKS